MKPMNFKFKNLKKDEMLIAGYVEPQVYGGVYFDGDTNSIPKVADVTKEQAFDDLKASGINTLLSVDYPINDGHDDVVQDIAENLEKRDMNYIIKLQGNTDDRTFEDAKDFFKKFFAKYENFNCFAGIHVADESGYKEWEKFGRLKKAFKEVYPDKLYYVNLLQVYAPTWAFPNGPEYSPNSEGWLPDDSDYNKYYNLYMEKANPEIFSYDFYPCKGDFPKILENYFLQLHLAYKYSKKNEIPILAFIQTCTFGEGSRIINKNELMWQINMAFAYNTKAIAYFCYWNPYNLPHWRQAFVDCFGNKTTLYSNGVKANNYIKYVDEYLLNADFKGYLYCGTTPNNEIPSKEDRLETFGSLKCFEGGNLFIGCFDYYIGSTVSNMYYVVNNDIVNYANVKLLFNSSKKFIMVLDNKTEEFNADKIEFNLDAGFAGIIIEK